MKPIFYFLLVSALVSGVYGYWGMFTVAGNRRYDEMDGIIPFGFLVISGLLATIVAVMGVIHFIRKRKKHD